MPISDWQSINIITLMLHDIGFKCFHVKALRNQKDSENYNIIIIILTRVHRLRIICSNSVY